MQVQQAAVQAQGMVGQQLMGLEQQLATQARQHSEQAMEMATRTEIEQYLADRPWLPWRARTCRKGSSTRCPACQAGTKWRASNTLQRILNSIAGTLASGAPELYAVITGFLLFFALLGLVILCYGAPV